MGNGKIITADEIPSFPFTLGLKLQAKEGVGCAIEVSEGVDVRGCILTAEFHRDVGGDADRVEFLECLDLEGDFLFTRNVDMGTFFRASLGLTIIPLRIAEIAIADLLALPGSSLTIDLVDSAVDPEEGEDEEDPLVLVVTLTLVGCYSSCAYIRKSVAQKYFSGEGIA